MITKMRYPTAEETRELQRLRELNASPVTQIIKLIDSTTPGSSGEKTESPIPKQLPVQELPPKTRPTPYPNPVTDISKDLMRSEGLWTPSADYDSPTRKGASTLRKMGVANPVTSAAMSFVSQ